MIAFAVKALPLNITSLRSSSSSVDERSICFKPQVRSRNSLSFHCQANSPTLDALLFDCDGVLVDTERDGHRLAFNEAFKQKGIDHEWGVDLYGKLLETGGGKERMTVYFKSCEDKEPFLSIKDEAERKELVKGLHLLKTNIFMEMVESGAMPLRSGVTRLIDEAMNAEIPIAVCSTSNERAVSTIVKVLLGDKVAQVMKVFAGDIVPNKKPSPDIYNLAAEKLNVNPAKCLVIEDSAIGVAASKAAGMKCIVTRSSYTQTEDFSAADGIFDTIGDKGDERFSLEGIIEDLFATAAEA